MHRPICLACCEQGAVHGQHCWLVLCEAGIDVLVHFCDLVRRVDGDGRALGLWDARKGGHNGSSLEYFQVGVNASAQT